GGGGGCGKSRPMRSEAEELVAPVGEPHNQRSMESTQLVVSWLVVGTLWSSYPVRKYKGRDHLVGPAGLGCPLSLAQAMLKRTTHPPTFPHALHKAPEYFS
ncbi:hypothetical protein BHM03_00015491, partial [Ensete ventricosum]